MSTNPLSPSSDISWIPASLSNATVAIWGIGLMGGSLAMALRGKTASLLGIDPDKATCSRAEEMNIFDETASDPSKIISKADLVILCAPLGKLPDVLQELPKVHSGHAVVMDIGSTKNNLLPLMEQLPERFAPIGGHPMCGKEVRTLSNACVDLYRGGSFALLPLPRTPQAAARLALQLVEAVGAHPIWLDPTLHDRWVASISHLPYLVAIALSAVTPLEAAPLVGPGYKSTTRLAGESIEMMIDILTNNRENVLAILKNYRQRMGMLEEALEAADFDKLETLFQEGDVQRDAILEVFLKGGGS